MRDLERTRSCDFGVDEPVRIEVVAEIVGIRPSVIRRLARAGLIESIGAGEGEVLVSGRTVIRLRRIGRLRRDLGVNFAGASVILDLVAQLDDMRRELRRLRGAADVDDLRNEPEETGDVTDAD